MKTSLHLAGREHGAAARRGLLVDVATGVEERLRPGWWNPHQALGNALYQRDPTHRRLP
jgi:hypothetical protein